MSDSMCAKHVFTPICGFGEGTIKGETPILDKKLGLNISLLGSCYWNPNIPGVESGNWLEWLGAPQVAFYKMNRKRGGLLFCTCHSYQIKPVALVTSSLGRIWDCRLGRANWGVWRVWGAGNKKD
jgi:hypothetical protein